MKAILGQYYYAPHRRSIGVWQWTEEAKRELMEHSSRTSEVKKKQESMYGR